MKKAPERTAMKKGLVTIWILLAALLSGIAQAQTSPVSRDPQLRQIEPGKDGAALARIAFIREKLPEQYRERNNFAWAVAKIDGLSKVEYFAHSGIQDLDGLSSKAAKPIEEISIKPREGKAKFKTLCVNQNGAVEGYDCWDRNVDTEFKILEDMASRLKNTSATGSVRLFTELYPCPSCWNVMKQFLATYTNVQMQVLYRRN
jgi:hypothetical protein